MSKSINRYYHGYFQLYIVDLLLTRMVARSSLVRGPLFNHVSVAIRAQNLLAKDNPWRILVAPRSCIVPRSIKALSFVTGCALTLYTCFGAFCSVGSRSLSTALSPNLRGIRKTRSRYIAFMGDRLSQTCSCRQSNTTGRQRAELIAFIRCHGRLQTCECALAAAPPSSPSVNGWRMRMSASDARRMRMSASDASAYAHIGVACAHGGASEPPRCHPGPA